MKAQSKTAKKWLVMLCACVAWTSGCFTRRAPARPAIGVVGFAHPVIPQGAGDTQLEPPPILTLAVLPAPIPLATTRSAPGKPRPPAVPTPEATPAEKTAEPTIAPEVTSEVMTEAKTETQQSLDSVEKNLAVAWGRTLNATQQDLISKVRGFTENAREAMRNGNWVRAKNLSKKAEVLSQQLAASL